MHIDEFILIKYCIFGYVVHILLRIVLPISNDFALHWFEIMIKIHKFVATAMVNVYIDKLVGTIMFQFMTEILIYCNFLLI